MLIRAPQPGDGAGMARIWVDTGAYYAELDPEHFQVPAAEGLADSFESTISAQAGANVLRLVAVADDTLAGWVTAHIEPPVGSAARQLVRELAWTRLFVDAIVVDRPVWHRGIGTALLEAAQAWGQSRGAAVARLDTYAEGPVAVPFYERHMGYQRRSIVFQKGLH
jgi:GNAT superfamily N-acetyltransferase